MKKRQKKEKECSYAAKVYFTKEINPENVIKLYHAVGKTLSGKTAIKLHSGEVGNQNFLKPDFWKPIISHVGGTVCECNTAYEGERNTTEKHRITLEKHGWSTNFDVDLLDATGPDMVLEIPNGKIIKKNYVGKDLANSRFATCAFAFQRPSHGRLRRRTQTAFHRHCLVFRQGVYPWRRQAGKYLDG